MIHYYINLWYNLMINFRFFSIKSLSDISGCISYSWFPLIFFYFLSSIYLLCLIFMDFIILTLMNNNHLRDIITFKKVNPINSFECRRYCRQLHNISVILIAIDSNFQAYSRHLFLWCFIALYRYLWFISSFLEIFVEHISNVFREAYYHLILLAKYVWHCALL